MVIEQISREGVLKASRESLGLSPSAGPIDDPLLAALLRRAAGILCPCSASTMIASVLEDFNTSSKTGMRSRGNSLILQRC